MYISVDKYVYIYIYRYLIYHIPLYFLNSVSFIARVSKFWLSPIYQCFPLMACICLLNFFVYTKIMKIFPVFSPRIYVVLPFIFVYKVVLKLTFDYRMRLGVKIHFFPHGYPIAPVPFIENKIKKKHIPPTEIHQHLYYKLSTHLINTL